MEARLEMFADMYEPVLRALWRYFSGPYSTVRMTRPVHACHAQRCRLVSLRTSRCSHWSDVFLCLESGNVHFCGGGMCDATMNVYNQTDACNHSVCTLTHLTIASELDHGYQYRPENGDTNQRSFAFEDLDEPDEPQRPEPPPPISDSEDDSSAPATRTVPMQCEGPAVPATAPPPVPAERLPSVTRRAAHASHNTRPRPNHARATVFRSVLETVLGPALFRLSDDARHALLSGMERTWALLDRVRPPDDQRNKKEHLTPRTFALWFVHWVGQGFSVVLHGQTLPLVPQCPDIALDPVKRNSKYIVHHHTAGEKAVQIRLQRVTAADVRQFAAETTLCLPHAQRVDRVHPHRALQQSDSPRPLPQSQRRNGHQQPRNTARCTPLETGIGHRPLQSR